MILQGNVDRPLQRDGIVTSVLIGASRPSQILDNIKALENTSFTEEELRIIDDISSRQTYRTR